MRYYSRDRSITTLVLRLAESFAQSGKDKTLVVAMRLADNGFTEEEKGEILDVIRKISC